MQRNDAVSSSRPLHGVVHLRKQRSDTSIRMINYRMINYWEWKIFGHKYIVAYFTVTFHTVFGGKWT
jgi:hypothetical protein